ncbi:MAG: lipopolysaccharide biosynthesis protein [Candidatus Levyibacteriota bacterium]|nr:MAG: lipopolysaccharide biosynthesis protein [Candidatus Levybacteria bacterium]
MGYTTQAIKGISWVGLLRGTTRIVSFAKIAILARILTPAQFGVYGIAALALSFLDVLTETGVNVILIQEKDDIDRHISSAWIVSIARGILMSGVILVMAPFVAGFFQSPDSLFLLQLISIVPLLRGFINPSVVKFQRDLQFKKEFLYRSVLFVIDAGTAVAVAFATHQAASIVVGLIVGVVVEAVLSFVVAKPRPTLRFENEYIAKIFHRGKWVTLSGVFQYLFQNVDNIVVGKLLGTGSLGLYQLGYSISILPISEVADVVSRVTFPVYTKIADDTDRLRKAFMRTVMIIACVTIPFGIILFFFSEQLITLVFGKQWVGVVPALRVLAIFGVIRAVFGFCATLFLAVGKQEYITVATLASITAMGLVIVPFVNSFGLIGAAYAALVGSVFGSIVFSFFTIKVLYSK